MELDFTKNSDQLIPAIIQDVNTGKVLMLGYMNKQSWKQTLEDKRVTFYSRTKERLWTKGEASGNFLHLESYEIDCDGDTLLIQVNPSGPVCHKGSDTCWGQDNISSYGFLSRLETVIDSRRNNAETKESYVASLFKDGINKIAQKVGEEAVETIIEAKGDDDDAFLEESADLLFHYLVLLQARGYHLDDVAEILRSRHLKK